MKWQWRPEGRLRHTLRGATGGYAILILVGAVLEALIYTVAGLCVIQLRRRQPATERSFRIPLGRVVPILTAAIFTALGLAAATTPTVVPLLITVALFALSYLYGPAPIRAAGGAPTACGGGGAAPGRGAPPAPALAGGKWQPGGGRAQLEHPPAG